VPDLGLRVSPSVWRTGSGTFTHLESISMRSGRVRLPLISERHQHGGIGVRGANVTAGREPTKPISAKPFVLVMTQ
jgi:hypothetical protein